MRPIPSISVAAVLALGTGAFLQNSTVAQAVPPLFDDAARARLVAYWNEPGRYLSELPPIEKAKGGPWAVRLTPEGSTFLLAYQRAIAGGRKIPPSQVARAAQNGPNADWENWISAKVAYDRAVAQRTADLSNAKIYAGAVAPLSPGTSAPIVPTPEPVSLPGGQELTKDGYPPLPPAPGPAPTTLVGQLGNPPKFASAVMPLQHTVSIDNEPYVYTDNVRLGERFAYYRFPQGVVSYGSRLSQMLESDRDKLFRQAGFSESDQKIFAAVSKLEGGFETVQTYDTGFVSVGFIQFVTLAEGKHDLCKVLQLEKRENPDDYKNDFLRFGLDVRADDTLVVVDPSTGVELSGPDAVKKIVDDKRLVAVFQRAGRHSNSFKVAQIKVAKSFYWPTADPLSVTLSDGTTVNGTIGEIVKSEAGLATLLDRKINTGNVRPLADIVARVMDSHNCKSFRDAVKHEREIVAQMKYRDDFLADTNLEQPPSPKRADTTQTEPEHGFSFIEWVKDLFR